MFFVHNACAGVHVVTNAGWRGGGGTLTYDTSSDSSGAGVDNKTFSHTIGGGSNRYLFVMAESEDGIEQTGAVSSITYNAVGMSSAVVDNQDQNNATIYYMLEADLPVAGAYDVVVTYDEVITQFVVGAVSFYNAKQEAPTTNSGTDTSKTSIVVSVNADADGFVVDALSLGDDTSWSATAPQAEEWYTELGSTMGGGTSRKAVTVTGSTTMTWSGGSTNRIALCVAEVSPL